MLHKKRGVFVTAVSLCVTEMCCEDYCNPLRLWQSSVPANTAKSFWHEFWHDQHSVFSAEGPVQDFIQEVHHEETRRNVQTLLDDIKQQRRQQRQDHQQQHLQQQQQDINMLQADHSDALPHDMEGSAAHQSQQASRSTLSNSQAASDSCAMDLD